MREQTFGARRYLLRRTGRWGFTLMELLVVIAIIATLAAVVAPAIFRNVGDAKTSAAKSQIEMLSLALNTYRLDNDAFPTTSQGLLSKMPTPFESARLNLTLFDLRREPALRAARAWFLSDFNPESFAELGALVRGEHNAAFRMVLGY